jgi:hypothetical protein
MLDSLARHSKGRFCQERTEGLTSERPHPELGEREKEKETAFFRRLSSSSIKVHNDRLSVIVIVIEGLAIERKPLVQKRLEFHDEIKSEKKFACFLCARANPLIVKKIDCKNFVNLIVN